MRNPISFLWLLALGFSSCQLVGKVLFGIRSNVYWMEPEEIHHYFDKYDVPTHQRFELDTASYHHAEIANYKALAESADSATQAHYRKIANDNLQMFQIRFFDGEGAPIFKMVNCYIDPPLPVSWNKHGSFDQFPPTIDFMQSGEGNQPLEHFLKHIHTLDQKPVSLSKLPEANFYAVVFTNDLFTRVGRRQMRTMKKYVKKHEDKDIYTLFVHNNNQEMWQMAKQQGLILENDSVNN